MVPKTVFVLPVNANVPVVFPIFVAKIPVVLIVVVPTIAFVVPVIEFAAAFTVKSPPAGPLPIFVFKSDVVLIFAVPAIVVVPFIVLVEAEEPMTIAFAEAPVPILMSPLRVESVPILSVPDV